VQYTLAKHLCERIQRGIEYTQRWVRDYFAIIIKISTIRRFGQNPNLFKGTFSRKKFETQVRQHI
jgi:hypothetical protein